MEHLLTLDEVAEIVKLHRQSVTILVNSGKFPQPIMVGKVKRWHPQVLRDYFLENGSTTASDNTSKNAGEA